MKRIIIVLFLLCSFANINAQKRYRGFVDLGYSIGVADDSFISCLKQDKLEFLTTHGIMVNSHIFLGGGIGINYVMGGVSDLNIPVYAAFQYELISNSISPFFNFKAGYSFSSVSNIQGPMISPAFGVKFPFKEEYAFNLAIAPTFLIVTVPKEGQDWTEGNIGISIRGGFEF